MDNYGQPSVLVAGVTSNSCFDFSTSIWLQVGLIPEKGSADKEKGRVIISALWASG